MNFKYPSVLVSVCFLIVMHILYLFFTLAAASLKRSSKTVLEDNYANKPSKSTALAIGLLGGVEYYLLVCVICHFCVVALIGVFSVFFGISFANFLVPNVSLLSTAAIAVPLFLVVILLILISAQIVKAYAVKYPELNLRYVAHLLYLSGAVVRPFVMALRLCSRPILRAIGLRRAVERSIARSTEEISEIVAQSSKAGNIEEDEEELFQGVVKFSDARVHEVMTPRKDIIAVKDLATLEEVVWIFKEEGISRVVVTGDELDDVKGILIAKDLIPLLASQNRPDGIAEFIREHISVPGTMKLDELLQRFQREANHFAIVLDEHGGVDGVVTLEDLVEEIVGEIFDEHDSPEDEQEVRETLAGELIVDGSAPIDDLNQEYGFDFPDGEYDTIAGFIIDYLNRIPVQGEQLIYNNSAILIESVSHNRILSVKLQKQNA